MPQINQAGALNTSALTVPDLYVQIVPPQLVLQGQPSNRLGFVGTASWGPVNTSVIVSGMGSYYGAFGPKQNKTTDLGIAVNIAALNGVSDMRCVRVTDGTDVAAALTNFSGGVTVVASCTGTAGNAINVQLLPQTQGAAFVVSHASLGTRTYTGPDWPTIANNVNGDPTALVRLPLSGTPALTPASATLGGGTDGVPSNTTAYLGSDASGARAGLYALRNTGCAVASIVGVYDATLWSQMAAYGLSEGTYVVTSGSPSQSIQTAVNILNTSGAASTWLKVMFGDWIYVNDDTFGIIMVSPALFAAAKLAALAPSESSLNKAMVGVVGSQRSGTSYQNQTTTYSNAELAVLVSAGIDVITNPLPGGAMWGCRIGHNSSQNAAVQGDNYTRMTGYIAKSLALGAGQYDGRTINDNLLGDIRAGLLGLLQSMLSQGLLAMQGTSYPYSVVCDSSNNPQVRTALGYVQADIAVRYQGINEKFIVNMQGGTTTVIVANSAG